MELQKVRTQNQHSQCTVTVSELYLLVGSGLSGLTLFSEIAIQHIMKLLYCCSQPLGDLGLEKLKLLSRQELDMIKIKSFVVIAI